MRDPTKAGYVRPQTVERAAIEELRAMITTGRLPPGAAISQSEIALEMGVSTVPVRDALRVLEGEGRVVYQPHRGYSVADLTVDDITQILLMSSVLEAEAIRAGMGRLTAEDLDSIEKAMKAVVAAGADPGPAVSADLEFHRRLMEPCGMVRLVDTIMSLQEATAPYIAPCFDDQGTRRAIISEHRRIFEAVSRADLGATLEALDRHRALERMTGPQATAAS